MWENGKATSATLKAKLDLTHRIIAPKGQKVASVTPAPTIPITGETQDEIVLPVRAGQTYTVHLD